MTGSSASRAVLEQGAAGWPSTSGPSGMRSGLLSAKYSRWTSIMSRAGRSPGSPAHSCEGTPQLADADHGGRGVRRRRRPAGWRRGARRGRPRRPARSGTARRPPPRAPPPPATSTCSVSSRRVTCSSSRTARERPALPASSRPALSSWSSSQSRWSRSPSSEERVRRLRQRAAGGPRGGDHVRRVGQLGAPGRRVCQRRAARRARRAPRGAARARRATPSMPSRASVWESSTERRPSRAMIAAGRPARVLQVPARAPSTSQSTPSMSSICTPCPSRGSANSASISSQRSTAPVTSRAIQ